MKRLLLHSADLAVLVLLTGGVTRLILRQRPETPASEFARVVDLAPLEGLAVQTEGRIKSFDSHARGILKLISGRRTINGQSPMFSYLDLMLRPEANTAADAIYIKNKNVRQRMLDALGEPADAGWGRRFLDQGLISAARLRDPKLSDLLRELNVDVMRTAKDVEAMQMALRASDPTFLLDRLTIVPPPGGDADDRWFGLSDLLRSGLPADDAHAGMAPPPAIPGLSAEAQHLLTHAWSELTGAWREQDAAKASAGLASFVTALRGVSPEAYPDLKRLSLETWYMRNEGMTWGWLVYLAAVIPLLMSVVYRWSAARWIGLALFLLAFALHTASVYIRWRVVGRWPNANMFEAVNTAAWFGAFVAVVLELVAGRTPMRNLFALGAAVCSMAAMMAGRFTQEITPDISNVMPILDDIWIYIHTNVIIASYALIGMASITALVYLRYRLGGGSREVAKAGGAGTLILANAPGAGSMGNFLREGRAGAGMVLDGATMILMELSFVMLWAGLVMGAIWADHSWGRPWGWDPKEVFALNTFIIFLLLVHVRLKVRDKGLWTALLAVLGCGVMLFNWIVINFKISGLHSYA